MPVLSSDLRATMAHFATGVTVVTTVWDSQLYGMTVNAFCSVSLDPALILVSLDLNAHTYSMLHRSGIFAVNILTTDQQHLARRFACKDAQSKTFDDIPFWTGEVGAPLFMESLAWIECRVASEYPGGSHALVLGDVLNVANAPANTASTAKEPLLYYRSSFWNGLV